MLMIIGVLIALLPFSGLPGSWRNVLCVVLGLSVTGIVYYHTHIYQAKKQVEENDTVVDNIEDDAEE